MTNASDDAGLADEFQAILKPLEEGDLHEVAAHDALNFLFCNWTQLAVLNELDDADNRVDSYMDMYDALIAKLEAIRPMAKKALEEVDARYPSTAKP